MTWHEAACVRLQGLCLDAGGLDTDRTDTEVMADVPQTDAVALMSLYCTAMCSRQLPSSCASNCGILGLRHLWVYMTNGKPIAFATLQDMPSPRVLQHNGLGALSVQQQQVMEAYGLHAVELLNESTRGSCWR